MGDGRWRRRAVPFMLGAGVVLVALVLIGRWSVSDPPFAIVEDDEGTSTLTGSVAGQATYRFRVPAGLEPVEEDGVVLAPTADAPVAWSVTVDVIPADGPLTDVVDAADLRERLPAYGDGRSLLTDPTAVQLDGIDGWTYEVLDEDGDPYVVRNTLLDRDEGRYAIALAVPQPAHAEWMGPLVADVLGMWEWLD